MLFQNAHSSRSLEVFFTVDVHNRWLVKHFWCKINGRFSHKQTPHTHTHTHTEQRHQKVMALLTGLFDMLCERPLLFPSQSQKAAVNPIDITCCSKTWWSADTKNILWHQRHVPLETALRSFETSQIFCSKRHNFIKKICIICILLLISHFLF